MRTDRGVWTICSEQIFLLSSLKLHWLRALQLSYGYGDDYLGYLERMPFSTSRLGARMSLASALRVGVAPFEVNVVVDTSSSDKPFSAYAQLLSLGTGLLMTAAFSMSKNYVKYLNI